MVTPELQKWSENLFRSDEDLAAIEFPQMALEVYTWGQYNFGDNKSKIDDTVSLGHIGPLLGIVEECGETEDAEDVDAVRDGAADTFVYFCDFCMRTLVAAGCTPEECYTRLRVIADRVKSVSSTDCDPSVVLSALGKLAHPVLKMHQGIRKVPTYEVCWEKMSDGLTAVFRLCLARLASTTWVDSKSAWSVITDTWRQVRERDWVTYPATGRPPITE